MIIIVFCLVLLVSAEFLLRFINPYRLFSSSFDESLYCQYDDLLGWAPSPNSNFSYYHKYLGKQRKQVFQNQMGLPSLQEFTPSKPPNVKYRILFFGETTSLGWELDYEKRITSLIATKFKNLFNINVEVIPIIARNYSPTQLYRWFLRDFKHFEYDIVIYNFNENNPRRSITFHESGKPPLLTQPVLTVLNSKLVSVKPLKNLSKDDMCFLDSNNAIRLLKSSPETTLHSKLKNNFHIYQLIDDFVVGDIRLRKFKNKSEIKDIEKWKTVPNETPYQWIIFKAIMKDFINQTPSSIPFLIVPNLQYYNAGNNWLLSKSPHPLGHNFEDIPSRKHLKKLAQNTKAKFCDIYSYVYKNKIDTSDFYIHPRYAYYSNKGASFHADYIIDSIKHTSALDF